MDFLGGVMKLVAGGISSGAKRHTLATPAPVLPEPQVSSPGKSGRCFTVGYGESEVMPEGPVNGKHKYWVAGYRINNPATGVLDPLMARAIWIDDNTGLGGVVFCAVDCVGLFSYDVNIMRANLADFCKQTGCRSINICSTHDHAGIDTMGIWGPLPQTGRDAGFIKKLYEGVERAIVNAYKTRTDGKLFLGYGHADEGMQRDDRLPQVFSDRLTRLRFAPANGGSDIYFLNFASHSESLQGQNSLVSCDFPCYIEREIMEEKGAKTMYCVGAIGGLVRMWDMDDDPVVSTKKIGKRLGEIVCSITEEKELTPEISFIRNEFYIPAENPVLIGAAKLDIIPASAYDTGEGSLHLSLRTEMTLFKIGSLEILALPGELFPELAYGGYLPAEESADGLDPSINPEPLCSMAKDPDLLIIGLCNDEIGYIPTPNDFHLHPTRPYLDGHRDRFDRRHYEETNSLGQYTASYIAESFARILELRDD